MNSGKLVKNFAKKCVESPWEKVVGKSKISTFTHELVVLHTSFTKQIHIVLHKKKSQFFPVKRKFYTLST